MRQPKLPAGGSCRCSATQFEILAPPITTLACHCVDCQKMSASAFSLGAMIPVDGFKIVKGTPVARPLPGSRRHHFFCPICMNLMFTKIEGADARVNVRTTLCHDSSWFTPFVETMTKDKLPWAVSLSRCRWAGVAYERRELGHSQTLAMRDPVYPSHLQPACWCKV